MCDTCGCQQNESILFTVISQGFTTANTEKSNYMSNYHSHEHKHFHYHDHDNIREHSHEHSHDHEHTYLHNHIEEAKSHRVIEVKEDVLHKNNLLAYRNKGFFEAKNIKALNIVSSPGSGKTTLLIKTIEALRDKILIYVLEGDQQTTIDAQKIHSTGVNVVQINTGKACHLDAQMVYNAVHKLQVDQNSLLFIENVGNLVCPAIFDLGESYRIVISSVTEGTDKPLKYPYIFRNSNVCIINKIDLLPYVDFDIDEFKKNAFSINHHLIFFEISARTSQGLDKWLDWLLNLYNK